MAPAASPPAPTGPTALAARALAPDLARGFMLLFIALANIHFYLYGHENTLRAYPVADTVVDQLVTFVQMLFVDGRSYPMFAFLFGYGMVQLMRRQQERGNEWLTIRGLLRRRGWWMLLFGLVHGVLLFSGDILGSYALAALVFVGCLAARDRTILRLAVLFLVIATAFGLAQGIPNPEMGSLLPSMGQEEPLAAVVVRSVEWVFLTLANMISVVPAVLLGILAGRRRVLDEPDQHRALLVRGATLGLGVAILGGLPFALMVAHFWPDPSAGLSMPAAALHTLSGYAGGLGWAALIALVAIRVGDRRGPVTTAVEAVGQRSMTCYLLQSVVFVSVLAPYAGGLGGSVGVAGAAAIAVATWLLSVVVADLLRRGGYRGPADSLLRRLTYRTRRTSGINPAT
ncbi:DUF418 domain-containing protein [Actinopolymorpha pittospori]